MSLHSYKWTSPSSCQGTRYLRPQLPTEPWHLLPLCISLWNIPLKQGATSAWLLRSKNSCHMQHWTPPAKHWGVPPQKGQHPWPWVLHPLLEWNSSKPVATSSQASLWVAMPDITKPNEQTPKVVCTPATPPARTPGADTGGLPKNVILLQEEMNRTMGCLLMTRSSLDPHWWKQVLDFEMALHQNETEAIREAKAHCGAAIREVEAHHTTHIREAKAHCTTYIREAEADCASIIREAEANCTSIIMEGRSPLYCWHLKGGVLLCRTCLLHPTITCWGYAMSGNGSHGRGREKPPLLPSHLWKGTAGLPPRSPWGTNGPLQLLTRNISLATLLAIHTQVSYTREESTLVISHATTPGAPRPSLGTKWWHHLPNQAVSSPQLGDEAVGTSEELPHLRQKDKMPFQKSLKGSWQEAFMNNSDLVQQPREDSFRTNCPCFNCKTLCNLSGVFWDMITYASLLGSQIYEIQEAWTGWEDLQYTNNALKTLLKGQQFFCPVSPFESPKVMGL